MATNTEDQPGAEPTLEPLTQVSTAQFAEPVGPAPVAQAAQQQQAQGAASGGAAAVAAKQAEDEDQGQGGGGSSKEHAREEVDDEVIVWESRYSIRNFYGRLTGMVLLTVAWIALAVYTWGGYADNQQVSIGVLATLAGIVVGVMWLTLIRRMILALYGHYYRLTNRRLFVSTGLFRRRRDQLELLRVQDVYTKQTLYERMMGLGTVVVNSSEQSLPIVFLAGVDDPKVVMDLVWRQARMEREGTAVQVDQI